MSGAELVRRACLVFRSQREMGGRAARGPLATIVRAPERPEVWDANHASGVLASTPEEIEAVLQDLDAAMSHTPVRKLFCDPFTPQPFVARLVVEGFEREATVQLVLEGALRARPRELDVRRVQGEEDWTRVGALLAESLREDARTGGRAPPGVGFVRQMTGMRRGMSEAMHTWLVREAGEDCAYLSSWSGLEGLGMVEWLFVRPDRRRRGIATALLAHGVADARARGAGPVLIGASAGPDAVARRLYASLGFRPVCLTEAYTQFV